MSEGGGQSQAAPAARMGVAFHGACVMDGTDRCPLQGQTLEERPWPGRTAESVAALAALVAKMTTSGKFPRAHPSAHLAVEIAQLLGAGAGPTGLD